MRLDDRKLEIYSIHDILSPNIVWPNFRTMVKVVMSQFPPLKGEDIKNQS